MPTLTPSTPPAPARYSSALIALHWLMFGILIAVFASIELRVLFEKGSAPRDLMKLIHFSAGLVVLALVVLRIASRLVSPQPAHAAGSKLAKSLAQGAHWALYAVMIGMPLLGWLSLSAAGKPIPFLGLMLPALMAPDKAWAHQIKELHETIGVFSYWLIGLHIAAALGHHWVLKDALMARMSLHNLRKT